MNKNNLIYTSIARLKHEPHLLIPAVLAWINGWWYKIKFFVLFKKFHAGKFFRVYGKLNISGPGKVHFSNNCMVISNAIKPVNIRTFNAQATVFLGDSAGLNGTSIQCNQKIEIGSLSNIADAYITDTAAHTLDKDRRSKGINDAACSAVIIGKNVWVSVQVVILHGVQIGDNSVIGACSLVRKNVNSNVLAAGNPLKIIRNID